MTGGLEPERCAACGATFGCGARAGGCWCNDVSLSPEATARARELGGETCLCPQCLAALGAGTTKPEHVLKTLNQCSESGRTSTRSRH